MDCIEGKGRESSSETCSVEYLFGSIKRARKIVNSGNFPKMKECIVQKVADFEVSEKYALQASEQFSRDASEGTQLQSFISRQSYVAKCESRIIRQVIVSPQIFAYTAMRFLIRYNFFFAKNRSWQEGSSVHFHGFLLI